MSNVLSKEAALVIGGIVAIANGIVTVAGVGGFEDGLQWEDLIAILTPLLGAWGIRELVFSKETVEEIMAGTALKSAPVSASTQEPARKRRS